MPAFCSGIYGAKPETKIIDKGNGKKNVLTSINPKTGVEQEATWLKQSPVALFGGNGRWFVVVRDEGGNLVVSQGKQGY